MRCSCEEWNKFMCFLDGMVMLAYEHGIKLPEHYPPWKYCPWCREELIDEEEQEEHHENNR